MQRAFSFCTWRRSEVVSCASFCTFRCKKRMLSQKERAESEPFDTLQRYLCMQRWLFLPEIAVFVLNLSDIIFLQTAPHTSDPNVLLSSFYVSLSRWGSVLRLPVGKDAFSCYSSSSRTISSLICLAWEQYKLAQALNGNLISEWLYWRRFKWKKSHLKIPIELNAIQTLTKLLYWSVT